MTIPSPPVPPAPDFVHRHAARLAFDGSAAEVNQLWAAATQAVNRMARERRSDPQMILPATTLYVFHLIRTRINLARKNYEAMDAQAELFSLHELLMVGGE